MKDDEEVGFTMMKMMGMIGGEEKRFAGQRE
jgi:hypothetical protein